MIAVRRLDELTAAARLLVETLRATDAPSS
jgi:hypothetical protein